MCRSRLLYSSEKAMPLLQLCENKNWVNYAQVSRDPYRKKSTFGYFEDRNTKVIVGGKMDNNFILSAVESEVKFWQNFWQEEITSPVAGVRLQRPPCFLSTYFHCACAIDISTDRNLRPGETSGILRPPTICDRLRLFGNRQSLLLN